MGTAGDAYETYAAEWLCQRGHRLLQRNYRARTGEIDLITLHENCLVFVEVRARSNPAFGGAAATVGRQKQKRLLRTAEAYLLQHPVYNSFPCRFDVLAFEPRQSPHQQNIQWIRGAFIGA